MRFTHKLKFRRPELADPAMSLEFEAIWAGNRFWRPVPKEIERSWQEKLGVKVRIWYDHFPDEVEILEGPPVPENAPPLQLKTGDVFVLSNGLTLQKVANGVFAEVEIAERRES